MKKGKKPEDLDESIIIQSTKKQSVIMKSFSKLRSFIRPLKSNTKIEPASPSKSKKSKVKNDEGLVYHRPVIDCLNGGFSKESWELSQVELNKLRLPYKGDIDNYADVNSFKYDY